MLRSTPEMGGPFTSTHKQACPRVLTASQQASLGEMGLNGVTAALQGIISTSAEKNVLLQPLPSPRFAKPVRSSTKTNNNIGNIGSAFE
ncbi:hypothetical protein SLE2022_024150 [Rubroshorea leprosula]